jgi:hypothetical protein
MPSFPCRPILPVLIALLALGAAQTVPSTRGARQAAQQQTVRLGNEEFWRLSSEMSEAGGAFQSDNFTSNEQTFPTIVNYLRATKAPGGVYMGVGPEQNFHYIVALRPTMAFLLDIRRQAVMQHFMYKALFELSNDRNEFISRLFSLPRQAGLDTSASVHALIDAYAAVRADPALWTRNHAAVIDHLTKTRGFPLSAADIGSLSFVYEAFYRLGPAINYNGYGRGGGANRPGFATLARRTDIDGIPRSFLATEASFRLIKDMHARNAIVPVVGNFGGPKAIRAIGQYVKARGDRITAFYLSNVEQYLFQQGLAGTFYSNVSTLPLDSTSLFLRPLTGSNTVVMRAPSGERTVLVPPGTSLTAAQEPQRGEVCPILAFLRAARDGYAQTWREVRTCPIQVGLGG